ncbi:MAG: NADH-ubiquinone oxidoreductase-F iron-sulfur binding region domain-containing protein [Caldisphaera sp.]|jgi:formate dehydrogenase iron-sulfur subunit/NADH-quinone oxidoreductase subunit F|uniref:complex I 51 kDa subunit family protein n=1 Tax=Caldisphaera sp. TaxID=2060322 RepID=UPI00397AE592
MGRINLPKEEINTFYTFSYKELPEEYCRGLSCFVNRNEKPNYWNKAKEQNPRTYCLGKCYLSPSSVHENSNPRVEILSREPILSKFLIDKLDTLNDYIKMGGMNSYTYVITSMSQKDVINEVKKSGLRGRGGAGFPTGIKWESAYNQKEGKKYLIVNGDEGDPGAFSDRFLMEFSPYLVLEGALIAAYAIGADEIYFYIRREYPKSIYRIKNALIEIKNYFNKKNITIPKINVEVGKGSYVVGEETALINALMGRRPEPTFRPPYPTEKGLFGKPTVINNVETLSNVPYIVGNGGDKYYELGFSKSRGTKLLSLNSLFKKPGIYEAEFGITLEEIVEKAGGIKRGTLKGLLIGAPLSGIIRPEELNTRLGYEELREIGSSLGHGNIIAFNEETSVSDLLNEILEFASYESCGKCTPCRVGTRKLKELISKGYFDKKELNDIYDILDSLRYTSLCGLGVGAGEVTFSIINKYKDEVVR